MIRKIKREMNRRAAALGLAMSLTFGGAALAEPANNALPTGGEVRIGQADIGIDPDNVNKMNINQASQNVLIDWDTFNVGKENTVQFYQPGADSMAVNRVFDTNPSEIAGHILANGNVTLINPYGVNVYNGAQIDAGSFIASTHDLSVDDYKKLFPEAVDAQGNITCNTYVYQKDVSTYERDERTYWKEETTTGNVDKYYVDGVVLVDDLLFNDINHNGSALFKAVRVGLYNGKKVYYVLPDQFDWLTNIFHKKDKVKVEDLGYASDWKKVVDKTWWIFDIEWHWEHNDYAVDKIGTKVTETVPTGKYWRQISATEYVGHENDNGYKFEGAVVPVTDPADIAAGKFTSKHTKYENVDVNDKETIDKIIKGTAGNGYRKIGGEPTTLTTMAPGAGAIYNGGNINAQKLVALVARDITNTGTIEAANVYLGTMGKDFPTALAPTTPATDSTPTGSGTGWILNDDLSIYHSDNMAKGNGKQKEYGHYLIQHYDYAISVGEKDGKAYYYIDAKKLKGNEKLSDYGFNKGDIVELTKIGDFTTVKKQVHGYLDAAKSGQTPGLNDQYYTLVTAPGNNEDPGNNGGAGGTGNGDIPAGDDVTSVRNSGTINANETVAAEAMVIENTGDIAANKVYLGKTVSIGVDYKINVAADAATIANRVYNSGEITANGGTIVMAAKDAQALASYAVADTGVIQAGSLRNVDGTVQLVADAADIQVLGYVSAKDANVKATGGNITVRNMLEPKTKSIVAGNNVTISATNKSSESTGKQSRGGNINVEQDGEIVANNKVDIDGTSGAINIAGDITAKSAFVYGKKINVTSDSDIDAKSLEIKSNSTSMTVTDDNVADNISKISATALNKALNNANSVTLTVNEKEPTEEKKTNIVDININAALNRTAETDGTLSVNASHDVNINSAITAENGKLDVSVNSSGAGYDWQHKQENGKVYVNANVDANGGNVNLTGDKVDMSKKAAVAAATLNVNALASSIEVTDSANYDTSASKISAKALGDTLGQTQSVTLNSQAKTSVGDIRFIDAVTKAAGGETALTLNANRNVQIANNLKSESGKMNLAFNAGNAATQGGALLVEGDIETKGGTFSTVGETYIGLSGTEAKTKNSGERIISTSGGNINLGGDVVIATGGNVQLDAGAGNVEISGEVNSGNAYYYESFNGTNNVNWGNAKVAAENAGGHLATITGDIENAAVNGTMAGVKQGNALSQGSSAYTAGSATDWVENGDGTVSRDWYWAAGAEDGVLIQTDTRAKSVTAGQKDGVALKGVYTNWSDNEANGEVLGGNSNAQNHLVANYDEVKYSAASPGKWDDNGDGQGAVTGYVVEKELGLSSLDIKGNNVTLADIGAEKTVKATKLNGTQEDIVTGRGINNVIVTATGQIETGDITAANNINLLTSKYGDISTKNIVAGNDIVANSDHQITAKEINAGGKVDMDAKSVITVTGKTSGNTVDLNSSGSSIFVHDVEATGGNIDIQANYNVYTNSEDNYNTTVKAKGDVSIKAGNILGTGNVEAVEGSVNITSDNKVDTHAVKAGKDITMAGDYGVHAREIVEAGGNVGISSKAGDIKATTVNANGGYAFLNATGNTTVDEVKATDEVILTATNGKVLVNKGVTADDYVLVQGKEVELKGNVWSSEGNINVAATDGNVTAKEITSNLASVSVEATGNVVADVVKAGQATTVKATDININKEAWSNNGALTLDAKGNITAKQITSNNNNVTANAVGTFTADSVIAGKAAEVNAKEITLNSFSKGNSSLKLKADGSVIASDLQSDGFVKLTALDGDVSTGKIVAGNNGNGKYEEAVRIDATKGNIKVDGQITANGDVALYGQYGKDKSIQVLGDNASIESKAGNVTIHQQDGKIELGNTVVKAAKNVDVDSKYGDIAVKSINAGKDVNINVNSETQDSLENLYSNVDIADITAGGAATVKGKEIKLDKADVAGNVDLQAKKTITANDVASTGADVNMMAVTVNAVNTSAKSNVTISGETVNAVNTTAEQGTVAFTGDTVTAEDINAGKNIEIEGNTITTTGTSTAGAKFQVEANNASIGVTAAKDILVQTKENVTITGDQTADNSLNIVAGGTFTGGTYGLNVTGAANGWKVFLTDPDKIVSGPNSNNLAQWGTKFEDGYTSALDQYVFQNRPMITVTANDFTKQYATVSTGAGVRYSTNIEDQYTDYFTDGTLKGDDIKAQLLTGDPQLNSDGFARYAAAGDYDIDVDVTNLNSTTGYDISGVKGTVTVDDTDYRNSLENQQQNEKAAVSNAQGRGRIGHGEAALGTGVDRVLGLTEGTLSFSSISKNNSMRAVSYDVNVTPDKVNVSKSEKQGKRAVVGKANQYRSLQQRMTVNGQEADFNLAYNGAVLDVYPTDDVSKAMLQAGDATDNADIVAKALHTSFNKMGVELEDLDGVNVHIDATEAESK